MSAEPIEMLLLLDDWTHAADADDLSMLELCDGSVLDVGCGPGRLAEALGRLGHVVLGVDVNRNAVRQAVDRGCSAIRRDVFATLPGEGRWCTVLLADGNIGIGGDPLVLLRRLRQLLDPQGRVVVELAAPGTPRATGWATLDDGATNGFPWSVVGVDHIHELAGDAGFGEPSIYVFAGRWCAVIGAT